MLAVAGVPGDPNTYYFGAVAGGIFKSTNGGMTWTPTFDHQSISSIGAIAVADADHNILYAGSGEACLRGNISYGDGVYKSTDAGQTWTNVGLKDSRHIGAVIIDPRNPDIVLVAALGHAWGPNAERGVFRTADGGKTWQKVLYKDENTGAIDVVFDPRNSSIVYAAMWQVRRQPWIFNSGGPGSGLYKSTDGGLTWKQLQGHGLPEGDLGRIGISVSGADSNRVYALIEAKEGGLFRSDDAGNTWTRSMTTSAIASAPGTSATSSPIPRMRTPCTCSTPARSAPPTAARRSSCCLRRTATITDLWIDPTNPQRIINSNDGGVTISVDGGKTWTQQNNQPTAQFYHVATDNHWPYRVYGAQQDNSTVGIASYSDDGVIARQDWFEVGGGESGYISPDPRDPDIVYAGSDAAIITRYDHRTDQLQDVSPYPIDTSGNGADVQKYPLPVDRAGVRLALRLQRHLQRVAVCAEDRRPRPQLEGHQPRPHAQRQEQAEALGRRHHARHHQRRVLRHRLRARRVAAAEGHAVGGHRRRPHPPHPRRRQDVGESHSQRHAGVGLVSIIEASHHDAGTAYAAVDRHKLDDFTPLIYKTHDYGKTWTRITTGIPVGAYTRSVREDPKVKGLLYAGTETGVYFSVDDGAHWQPLQLNLPTSPVHDLAVKDNDLIAATHGRSFWILDDVSPLRQASTSHRRRRLPPLPARDRNAPALPRSGRAQASRRRQPAQGRNPLLLPEGEAGRERRDHAGSFRRAGQARAASFESSRRTRTSSRPNGPTRNVRRICCPRDAGMNRFAWDFRTDGPVQIPGLVLRRRSAARPAGRCPEPTSSSSRSRARRRPRHSRSSTILACRTS